MPTNIAAQLSILMEMDSAQLSADTSKARQLVAETGKSFSRLGGEGTKATGELSAGLKRGVRDVTELAGAMGITGDKTAKFGANLVDLALSGIPAFSGVIAVTGLAIGGLVEHQQHAEQAAKAWSASLAKLNDDLKVTKARAHDILTGGNTSQMLPFEGAVDEARKKLKPFLEEFKGEISESNGLFFFDAMRRISEEAAIAVRDYNAAVLKLRAEQEVIAAQSKADAKALADEASVRQLLTREIEEQHAAEAAVTHEADRKKIVQDLIQDATSVANAAKARAAAVVAAQEREHIAAENKIAIQDALAQLDAEYNAKALAAIDARVDAENEAADALKAVKAMRLEDARHVSSLLLDIERESETDGIRVIELSTEQRIAALEERSREEIALLEKHGEKEKAQEIRNATAAARARIEAQSEAEKAVTGDDFGAGFEARVAQLQKETAEWGRLGARVANEIVYGGADGIADAFDRIIDGSADAKTAFRDFAASFARDISGMIERQLLAYAIAQALGWAVGVDPKVMMGAGNMSAGTATSSAGGGTETQHAHGGSWRVGGLGGLDSKLVRMKVSPGELIRVSDGANSNRGRSGGDFNGTLVVRPPAVIADDVMAKSSREARAEVVGSVLHRSGRRGRRASD
jgi:hypothetical protein